MVTTLTTLASGATAATIVAIAMHPRPGVAARRPTPPDSARHARRWLSPHTKHVAIVLGAAASFIVIGPIPVLLAGIVEAARRRTTPLRERRRERQQIERDFPDAIDLLVLTIRAGLTPRLAVEALGADASGPCDHAFAEVTHRMQRGQPFADAVRALPDLLGPRASDVADAMSTCERYGLPLQPLLVQLAAEARASRRRLDQAAARKLPIRLSFPLVVCTLPSFVLLAIAPAVLAALSSLGGTAW